MPMHDDAASGDQAGASEAGASEAGALAREPRAPGRFGAFQNRSPTLEALADRLSLAARAETIFGAPVQHGAVTVVPVGRARWGLGGGWGSGVSDDGGGGGGGGGGGAIVEPVGFLEVTETGARFRPIVDPLAWARVIIVGGLVGLAITQIFGRRATR